MSDYLCSLFATADKVEIDVNERTALTQAENNDLDDKIEGVESEKNRYSSLLQEVVRYSLFRAVL